MRTAIINRKTAETDIKLTLNVDGSGNSNIDTGCGILDHMLTLFSKHARFDLDVNCVGDINVDFHHSAEDIGICLGKALTDALGNMKGIERYGDIILPMDETLILCATDISGRAHLEFDVEISTEKIGDFDSELIEEFFLAFVRNANLTLHFKKLSGRNAHHIAEGVFKAFGRTMSKAVKINEKYKDEIPSTKGVL